MVITPVEVFLGMVRVLRYRSGNRSNKIKVKPAEVICASCMFCTIERSRLERFLLTEQDWVRYNLLKNTIQTRILMDLDLKEYDVEEIRRALEYDFEYFNDFTHGLLTSDDEKGLCTLDEMEEIAKEESISQYNVIYLIFSVYSRLLAKPGARDLIRQCLDLTEKKKTVNKNDALSDANDIMTMRNALKEKLKDKVKGQDLAVDKFVDGFMRYKIRGSVSGKPAAVYLFAGPPGTGKTYMAETFAKLVADEGYKYKRFDMSAFGGNGNDNITGLVGFEKTWKAAQPGLLTEFVRKNPKCILLFDEIEKAGTAVRMLFLSVLEGAVLTDRYYDKQVSFEDAILIFTTNEGKDLYEDNRSVNLTTLSDAAVIEGLRASQFAPELISRFMSGNVVMFNHLSYSNMSEIFKVSVNNTMAGLGRDRFKFTMRRPEELQQLYFLNKGANIDARFVSSNTKKMVEDYFLQAMEYLGKQEEEALQELKEIVVSAEINVTVREYFKRKHKPRILVCGRTNTDVYADSVKNLYISSPEDIKLKKLQQIAECDFADYDSFKEFLQDCNWNSNDRKDKYDLVLIDLWADSKGDNVRLTETEGYQCLKTVEEENLNIPVVVLEKEVVHLRYNKTKKTWEKGISKDLSFRDEEKNILNSHGVTDYICGVFYDVEGKTDQYSLLLEKKALDSVLDRQHRIEAAVKLAKAEQKISADVTYHYEKESGKLEIIFDNLCVGTATEESAELRQQSKKYLLADKPQVRVKDVFGNALAKEAVKRCIDNIRHPEKYKAAGAKLMKGILMYGDPGMGKTMFAKALAFESGASFISTVGADFLQDGGLARLEEMFKTARRKKPCILFIDEFDAFTEVRREGMNQYVKSLLEKFLMEMDGLESDNEGVYVVGATNCMPDELDSAVMRRFSAKIQFKYPNMKERQEFLLYILKKKGLENVLSERAAKTLSLMMYERMRSYAEMESFIEESIAEAVYRDKPVTARFLFNRVHNETSGEANPEENGERMLETAFHEAGHAVLQWYFGRKNEYVTIVSRGDYGGYSMAKPKLYNGQDFLNHICICLAGRVAETLYLGEDSMESINIGAGSDLQKATQIAYEYVCRYGLGSRFLVVPGKFAPYGNRYPETVLPEHEKELIWNDVKRILEEQKERTKELLQENFYEVGALAISLVYMKELDGETVENIIQNKVPYLEESCFINEDQDYVTVENSGENKYLFGYPIYPRTEVKISLEDDETVMVDKKHYYTVKTDTEVIGVYEDIQTAMAQTYGCINASCRRFESKENAKKYLEMSELKVVSNREENFIGFKVDAMEEMIEGNAQEKRVIDLTEDLNCKLFEDAATHGLSPAEYLLGYIVNGMMEEYEDLYLVIRIYDKSLQQELIQCLETGEDS